MVKQKFPTVIFIRKEKDGDEEYLLAFEKIEEVIEDDGPTAFARYDLAGQFIGTKQARVEDV